MALDVHRYEGIIRPVSGDAMEWVSNGAIVTQNREIVFSGAVEEIPDELRAMVDGAEIQRGVAIPTTRNAHQHAFQLTWGREPLIYLEDGEVKGSLIPALELESEVRKNPELAVGIAHELCDEMIKNGIGEVVLYTTSSIPALENVLRVMCERGFKDRVKVGFVFMNQNIDKYNGKALEGVSLEVKEEEFDEVFAELERLNDQYPGMLTMIDRFPIAVSSPLRKRIVRFCGDKDLNFDTHVDESEEEAGFTRVLYGEKRIMEVLRDDGVFNLKGPNQTVRLAHGILTNDADFEILAKAKANGCNIEVVACPSSNLNIRSHWVNHSNGVREKFVRFPFEQWAEVADVSIGIDAGAGVTKSVLNEATLEVIRDPRDVVSFERALSAARVRKATLRAGAPADWNHVPLDQVSILNVMLESLPPDRRNEALIRSAVIGGASRVLGMYLGGQRMEPRAKDERPRLRV